MVTLLEAMMLRLARASARLLAAASAGLLAACASTVDSTGRERASLLVTAGPAASEGSSGAPSETDSLGGTSIGQPQRLSVSGRPVYFVLPPGYRIPFGPKEEWVHVVAEAATIGLTVFSDETAFLRSAPAPAGPDATSSAEAAGLPAEVAGWLAPGPELRVSAPVQTRVGGVPATQVDVAGLRVGGEWCRYQRLCVYVWRGPSAAEPVGAGDVYRFFFLAPLDGTRLAVRIHVPGSAAEDGREAWKPLPDSLVVG